MPEPEHCSDQQPTQNPEEASPRSIPARMGDISPFATHPSSAPIYQTTAFDVPDFETLNQIYRGEAPGYIYTRDSNPNHSALADSIAELEVAEAGAVFASGMGAIAAVALTLAESGGHVIVGRSLYGISMKLMERLERKFKVEITWVDVCDVKSVKAACRSNTKFCIIESISNPLLEVADIAGISEALGDVPLVVDNTFTTPMLMRPLQHGATLVVHSASKYLNGHGDVMLGVAAGHLQTMKSIRSTSSLFGQNANPFESWLTQRGLKTLPLRMKHICETTNQLAEFLNGHPAVSRTNHPSLRSHPTHQIASELYPNGCGGIISFELTGTGKERCNALIKACPSIPFSPTLADARTTFSHPASTSHAYMKPTARRAIGIQDELIRLSVGLEPFDVLRADLDAALNSLK